MALIYATFITRAAIILTHSNYSIHNSSGGTK